MSPILQPIVPIWNICLNMRYEILYFILHNQDLLLYLMLCLLSEKLITLLPTLLELKFTGVSQTATKSVHPSPLMSPTAMLCAKGTGKMPLSILSDTG